MKRKVLAAITLTLVLIGLIFFMVKEYGDDKEKEGILVFSQCEEGGMEDEWGHYLYQGRTDGACYQ
ncbi:MAG: hypothetical protein PWP24_612 [Clostridiales bacterium]|nr:hypothetical protein [Clostridiales bacterium]